LAAASCLAIDTDSMSGISGWLLFVASTQLLHKCNLSASLHLHLPLPSAEIENKVKELNAAKDTAGIHRILSFLSTEFAMSTQSNHRKRGLIGLAAAALRLNQVILTRLSTFLLFNASCSSPHSCCFSLNCRVDEASFPSASRKLARNLAISSSFSSMICFMLCSFC
jgi:hypothetical protein